MTLNTFTYAFIFCSRYIYSKKTFQLKNFLKNNLCIRYDSQLIKYVKTLFSHLWSTRPTDIDIHEVDSLGGWLCIIVLWHTMSRVYCYYIHSLLFLQRDCKEKKNYGPSRRFVIISQVAEVVSLSLSTFVYVLLVM